MAKINVSVSKTKFHFLQLQNLNPGRAHDTPTTFAGYVQQCATKGMRPSSCAARLRNYGPCTALRAGNFGMGLRCESPTGPLVMKVVLLEKDNLNTVRNSAKEVLIGCQASALKLHGVLDLFAEVYDFLWCAPGDAVAFLSRYEGHVQVGAGGQKVCGTGGGEAGGGWGGRGGGGGSRDRTLMKWQFEDHSWLRSQATNWPNETMFPNKSNKTFPHDISLKMISASWRSF